MNERIPQRSPLRALATAAALSLAAFAFAGQARAAEARHEKEGFSDLTVDEVAGLIEKKEASVFDNNQKERFDKSHVPSAVWLKFNEVQASDLPKDLERKLVFYCANAH
jgi:Rhodanese-like domain